MTKTTIMYETDNMIIEKKGNYIEIYTNIKYPISCGTILCNLVDSYKYEGIGINIEYAKRFRERDYYYIDGELYIVMNYEADGNTRTIKFRKINK